MGSGLHVCWEMSARLLRSLSPCSWWDTLTHLIKLSDKWHCSAQMNLKSVAGAVIKRWTLFDCLKGSDGEDVIFFFFFHLLFGFGPTEIFLFVASTWSPNSCLPSPKKQTLELAAHLVCKVHPEFRMGKLWEPRDCGGGGDWRSLELERSSYKPERRRDASWAAASVHHLRCPCFVTHGETTPLHLWVYCCPKGCTTLQNYQTLSFTIFQNLLGFGDYLPTSSQFLLLD